MSTKYILTSAVSASEKKLFFRIDKSLSKLKDKLRSMSLDQIGLSAYNQRYLKEYLDNYSFFAPLYSQVLITALRELKKPVEDSVFVDYGGGSGFFSLLAKDLGFGKVIYNDIYNVSVDDARKLSENIDININEFICGDIDVLVEKLESLNISPDLICSFEVIEHIYKLENWFRAANKFKGKYKLVFSSSANIKNPYISRRLKKSQLKAENVGTEKSWGAKERDAVKPFLKIREEIITQSFPELTDEKVHELAIATRGFIKSDIISGIKEYLNSGKEIVPITHPTNTCDPFTGNWAEHLIDFQWLKNTMAENGFCDIEINPGLYTSSENRLVTMLKKFLNFIIKRNRSFGLKIAPIYILKAKKK